MFTATARRHVRLLPTLFAWVAVFLLCFSAVAAQAAPVTLTFNSDSGLGDGIANAGDGGSAVVPGKDIRITVAADSNGNPAGSIAYEGAWGGITYDDGINGPAMGFVIRSGNGSAFRFTSFTYLNWGDSNPTMFRVSGRRAGVEVASTSFDSVDPGFAVRTFTAPAGFENVDEVRLINVSGGINNGNGSWLAINNITLDDPPVTAPTVQTVTSPQTGAKTIGETVAVRVQFSEPVTVAGTPTLQLETGTIDRLAVYAGGSGTNTLTFSYTVQSGDFTSLLNYFSTGSLSAAGGTVRSASNVDASLVLPPLNSPNSLAAANLSVDGRAPVVTRVQASSPSRSYRAGSTVDVMVEFDKPVQVSGAPVLRLATGGSDNAAPVAGGSSNNLIFRYTVKAGDAATDLDYVSTTALELAGGRITDMFNQPAVLTLPAPGSAGSLAFNSDVVLDNVPPTVISSRIVGSPSAQATTLIYEIQLSEPWQSFTPGLISIGSTGTASASGVQFMHGSSTFITVEVRDLQGSGEIYLTMGTGTVTDYARNEFVGPYELTPRHTVAQPTAPGAPVIGTATAAPGQATVAFSAPAQDGNSPILDYTVTSSPGGITATGSGSPLVVTGLTDGTSYTFTVTARNAIGTSQPSGASNAATPQQGQSITFNAPGDQNYGTTPTLAASASSGLAVDFSTSTPAVCTVTPTGGQLTFVRAGLCTVQVSQPGNAAYSAATPVTRDVNVQAVAPGAPSITQASVTGQDEVQVQVTAPANDGGAAITGYTVTANPGGLTATGSGPTLTVSGLTPGISYTFTATATNAASLTGPASTPSGSVMIRQTQSIAFNAPGNQPFGTTPTLGATASSGLAITWLSGTPAVCAVDAGGTLDLLAVGSCTITARQAGDAQFEPATDVSQSFQVTPVAPSAPLNVAASDAGPGAMHVSFSAPAQNGGEAVIDYTVTAQPGGAQVTGGSSPILFSGLTNGTAYTFTVTARNSAGSSPASAPSTAAAPMATQAITFNSPGPQDFGTTPTLSATADSGLPVSFTSTTPAVCAVGAGNVLQFNSVGTCTVRADQAGNAAYLPAAPVSRDITVNAVVPGTPVVTSATAVGASGAQVGFSAPAFTGGLPITGYVVTAQPGGLTATGASSPIEVAGLTPGQRYTFSVAAVSAAGTGAGSAPSNPVQPLPALTVADVSATLAYNAAATPVTLSINGTPRAVQVATNPQHGTAVASGTGMTYQPAAGFAGTDTFTYTASDDWTTTSPALVTVTVGVPTVTVVAAAPVPAQAIAGQAYTRAFSASGGAAPYAFSLASGTLPAGLQLGADGQLQGTPTAAGQFTFTVQARDSSTGQGPFNGVLPVVLDVTAPTLAVEDPEPGTYGVAYRRALRAAGGVAPYAFRVTGGALPAGVRLGSDGVLEGVPEQAGEHAADIEVRDANGFTLLHALRWTVAKAETPIEAFEVSAGEAVYTADGSLQVTATSSGSTQPIVFGSITPAVCAVTGSTVRVLAAGRCSITANQAGDANHADAPTATLHIDIAAATPGVTWVGDLHKVFGEASFDLPLPQSNSTGAFTFESSDTAVATVAGRTVTLRGDGETIITARQAAAGSFSAATVTLRLRVQVRPDPTSDATVVGLLQAQVDASVRFANAQQANIRDRLRQVRAGSNASSNLLSLAYQAERGAGLSVPVGSVPGSAPALPEGWGTWAAGSATWGRGGATKQTRYDLQTDGVTVGVDHALGDTLLLGVAGSMGRNRSELDDNQTRLHADQRSLAVYGLWRIGEGLFVDALVANGQLDFNLRRWSGDAQALAQAERDGDQWFGSLAFGYDHRGDALTLTGYGRVDGSRTDLDGYAEQGAGIYDLVYRAQRVRNTAVALGLEGSFQAPESRLRPFWSVEYRQALDDKGDADLNYAQWGAPQDYRVRMQSYNDNALTLAAGLDIQVSRSWMLSLLLGHEQARGADSSRTVGLRLSTGKASSGAAGASASESTEDATAQGLRKCPPRGCPAR